MSFCSHYAAKKCTSCTTIDIDYAKQIEAKESFLHELLDSFEPHIWHESVKSPLFGFRNKAKMVAIPSAKGVLLGLNTHTSLIDCPLYPKEMQDVLYSVQSWLRELDIKAYDVPKKKGELKYVLLTRSSYDGSMMLRFVLRSHGIIPRLKKALERLRAQCPQLKVISVNIQNDHKAVIEGDEEIFLSEAHTLEERLNSIPLFIRPKSFFQTNTDVAQQLYAKAAKIVDEIDAKNIWDLFCGVGGFALHCASEGRHITGIEIEQEAIACAKASACELGFESLHFKALDTANFSKTKGDTPDVIIVNPPRRGLGKELCEWLESIKAPHILYSSCNPETLARDLKELKGYKLMQVQLFDMFPHTQHYEVLNLLKKI